jgi:dihydrofolate synthase/folylpolyglutamate synthase
LDGQSLWVWPAQDQAEADEFFRSDGARGKAPELLTTPLLGRHQVENAATAYTALQVLNGRGFNASREAIKAGFASVIWPGRFDILARHPFVVVDSAHNRDSALRLHQAMEEYFPGRPVVMVFGVSEDKDIRGMFSELLPGVQQVIMTQSQHPRAMDAGKLAELAEPFQKPTKAIPAVENALAFALEQVAENGVVLVTGSLFVAAAARAVWSEVINEK